ncbi:MAG: hypothetical protein ACYS22_05805, partial [Planctomycetota bacterium]
MIHWFKNRGLGSGGVGRGEGMTRRASAAPAGLGVVGALALLAGGASSAAAECVPEEFDLFAGQYHDVGSLVVSNDAENLYVTYTLDQTSRDIRDEFDEGSLRYAFFGTLHLWVGS